jgi:tRNA threonylcarbamoyladenosine biosynthesis protein TsaB
MIRILALDTTTRAGSTALVVTIASSTSAAVTDAHARAQIAREILRLASENQCALSDIDLYAVATGPGSFTGLRIGIATIQGLAHVHKRRVVGIPALEALAHAVSGDFRLVP